MEGWLGTAATTSIFIVAAVTDWLDGYIARKVVWLVSLKCQSQHFERLLILKHSSLIFPDANAMQMQLKSTFGAFLDPVADKVSLLVLYCFLMHIKFL